MKLFFRVNDSFYFHAGNNINQIVIVKGKEDSKNRMGILRLQKMGLDSVEKDLYFKEGRVTRFVVKEGNLKPTRKLDDLEWEISQYAERFKQIFEGAYGSEVAKQINSTSKILKDDKQQLTEYFKTHFTELITYFK